MVLEPPLPFEPFPTDIAEKRGTFVLRKDVMVDVLLDVPESAIRALVLGIRGMLKL